MQLVTVNNGVAVTTTLAIAEGTDVEHKAVIQLVRNYQNDLEEFGRVTFEMAPFETAGGTQKREVAALNEQQSTLILTYMRNSDIVRTFKKRLVKAFYELASRPAMTSPAQMSRLQLIQLAMQAEEERLALEHKVGALAPRAAIADRLDVAEGRLCIRDAAKALKLPQNKLVNWLLINKWLYRDMKGKLRGYADKTPKYIEHKITPIPTDEDAEKVSLQAMITPAGLTRLADIFNVEVEAVEEEYREAA